MGIGIRKRAPSLNNVEARTSLLTLQQADIVNMVDVDLSDLQEDAEHEGRDTFTVNGEHGLCIVTVSHAVHCFRLFHHARSSYKTAVCGLRPLELNTFASVVVFHQAT